MNYTTNKAQSQYFWIHLKANNKDYTRFLDLDLPTPTLLTHIPQGYIIAWAINGFAGTKAIQEYSRDIKDKLNALLDSETLYYNPKQSKDFSHVLKYVYELSLFSHIPDKRVKINHVFLT